VGRAVELVETAADELRRICKGLRPPLLDDLGLEPAAHLLAREFEDRTGLAMDFEVNLDDAPAPLSKEVSLCTYRIFQEALNNISRHSSAKSVDVTLAAKPSELLLSVYDDGQGFDTSELAGARGCGIAGMRERASLVGGHVEIRSAPSQGTRVVLRVPLDQGPREIAP
jgi:signal transduction histidine kinase